MNELLPQGIKTKKPNIQYVRLYQVTQSGIEPETYSLEGCCSIQLSYWAPKMWCKSKKNPHMLKPYGDF